MKMEETCQLAPPAMKLLGLPNHKSDTGISLTMWVSVITMHIRNTGMDSVFYVHKSLATTTFTDLLEEWNQFSNDEIHKWLEDEGMGFDKYNEENLHMSGQYLQNAMKPELWQALESISIGARKAQESLWQSSISTRLQGHLPFVTS